jgi:PAS domain S-box-containing protein
MYSVLYVDDDPNLLELCRLFLEESGGIKIVTVGSAQEALVLPELPTYDAIISDYQMPGMDGISFLKEIRQRFGNIPFILFTGRGREEVVIDAINHGADFYLQKGGDPTSQFAELEHKIRQVVRRRRAEETLVRDEERLRFALEGANDGIWDIHMPSGRTYLSPRGCEILGYAFEEFNQSGKSWTEHVHPEDIPATEAALARYREGKTPAVEMEQRIQMKSGEWKWVLVRGKAVERDASGNVIRMTGTHTDITERKKTEQELRASYEQIAAAEEELRAQYEELRLSEQRIRESEAKFRAMFEETHDALLLLTSQGVIDCNGQARSLYGIPSQEEFLGLHPADFSPPLQPDGMDSRSAAEIHIRNVQKKGTDHFEWLNRRKDGSTFSADILLSAFELNGKWVFLASIRDITDKKTAEAAMKKSDDELRLLKESVDRAADEVFWLDFEGNILYANDAACRTTGYSREEFLAMKIFDLDPDQTPEIWVGSVSSLREKKTNLFTGRHRRKNGVIFPVEIMAVYVNRSGIEYSFAFVRDITDRIRAEVAVRERDIRQHTMIANISDVIAVADAEGIVRYESENVERLFGWKPEEHVGLPFHVIAHPDDLDRINGNFQHNLREENASTADEFRYRLKDGSFRMIHLTAKNLLHDPRINGILVNYHDITEQKRAEDSLQRVNQKLNVLSQLTRQDLATQIYILTSYLEMAKNEAAGQDGILKNIGSGEQVIRSIGRITEFTKDYQNMGEKPPKWQNVKLAFLLGLSHITTGNIRHDIDTGTLEIFADPLLEKAFQGILENSFAHGSHVSEIRVTFTTTPDGVMIVYEDNGIGIPPGKKEEIFSHGNGTRASVRGLFFVREILDITGMAIRENGEPGRGARFEITVPAGTFRLSRSSPEK